MMTVLRSASSDAALSLPDLRRYADGWVLDCKYRQLSPRTVDTRQETTDKLLWFLTT